jgi:uncharacterized protein DUF2585
MTRQRAINLSIFIALVAGVVEWLLGRSWWCKCGTWAPLSWDVWSVHNSQHLVDWYSFSHVQHGLVFYAFLHFVAWRLSLGWRLVLSTAVEAFWEVLENSPIIIDRYRAVTASLDYYGDSIVNSVADIGCCVFGFWLAMRLSARMSVALFVVIEVVMVLWIRDSLLLNVLMLTWPIEAIRRWQVPA